MNTTRRSMLGAGVALVLAAGLTAGLTACSGGQIALIPTAGAAAATSSAAATPTAAVTAALATGAIVDAAQVDVILKAGKGQRAYPMADGTFVVVTRTEPLPAAVQADANAKAAAVVAAHPDGTVDSNAAIAAMDKAGGDIAVGTGKHVVVIWAVFGYPDSMAETKSTFWTVSGGADNGSAIYLSRSEAQAAVDTFVAAASAPSEFAVVSSD